MTDKVSWEAKIAAQLSAATSTPLTEKDLKDWVGEDDGAGPAYGKVDRVVKKYLGKGLYEEADVAARVMPVLEAALAGKNRVNAGGYIFTNLQKR